MTDYMDQREDVYAKQKKVCPKYIGEPGCNCTECGMIAYEHAMDWETPSETDAQKATAMIGAVINLTEGQYGTICGIIEAAMRRVR